MNLARSQDTMLIYNYNFIINIPVMNNQKKKI